MMLGAPKALGHTTLDPQTLAEDLRGCQKVGPCGIGHRALYLNSFYFSRRYYVPFEDLRRCFKRIAMSRGGFSGKGIFGSLPYLVVELADGREKQCNFKHEDQVDRFLAIMQERHPKIPVHSKDAERRLREAEREEEARYVRHLSAEASAAVDDLRRAKHFLDQRPEIGEYLSAAARRKRSVDGVKRSNMVLALAILIGALVAVTAGILGLVSGDRGWSVYLLLFGVAFALFTLASGVVPTVRHNRRTVQAEWDDAVAEAREYVSGYPSFPLPAAYAHPIVIERMIRIIREGRARDVGEAFEAMKQELRRLDHTQTVTQREYDEIVAVKPMFMVMDYH